MWLTLSQGAEYLVQKYGARIARRVIESPPPAAVDANGRRGYESSELEAWAKKVNHFPAGRGAPTSETTKAEPVVQGQGLVGQARDWMNDRSRFFPKRP